MSYNIGLNVIEVDGVGSPAIAGAATSVGAFNILTRRGVPNTPARITSFPDFVERFGGFFPNGMGAYIVKGFFDNGGGVAYCNRVASAASTPGELTLNDGVGPTLTLEGGFRGEVDPGSWALGLFARTTHTSSVTGLRLEETARASVTTPAALPATTDMQAAAFPSLNVTIDGAPVPSVITFTAADFANPASATRQEIVNRINAATDDLDASLQPTFELVLTSTGNIATLSGGFTSLAVTANATLGFPANLAGAATTSPLNPGGATLHRVDGLDVGDAIEVSDGVLTRIVKVQAISTITRTVSWAPPLVGAFNAIQTRIRNLEFDLEVFNGGTEVDEHRVELWSGLSMEADVANYAVSVLNDPLTGSTWVRAVDEGSAAGVGLDRPAILPAPLPFSGGGVDGVPTSVEFAGDAAARTGFFAFDPFEVQLVTCERTDPSIAVAGIAYCENRGDCMYVGAVPEVSLEAGTAVAYGQALQASKVPAAVYGPWLLVTNPLGLGDNPMIAVPPVGHVMGVYARIERTRGIWKAPAGDEARIRNVIDVTYRINDAEHTDLVRNAGVNGIRALPRSGVVIDSSRTPSTDTRWTYVNVRLLINYVKSSLRQGLGWVRQEPNKDTLWNVVKFGSVVPFLAGLWRQGAFGTGAPSEVFTVICDASNNPPAQVQLGFLNVEVYLYPNNPAETIVIKVGQQPSGAIDSES